MPASIIERIRVLFEGDPAVKRVADDPVLTAELMLLFRMVLADGEASGPELQAFKRICRDSFGIGEESLEEVLKYLQDYGYENTEARSLGAFGQLPLSRRIALGRHMAEIAKADDKLSAQEIELLKRTVSLLHIDPRDLVRPE
jgi:uncharacterized tellurite resistance protein B-like protein